MGKIDEIIEKLRTNQTNATRIIVSKDIYDLIEEEVQTVAFDYNSPTIGALSALQLIVDTELSSGTIILDDK